MITCYCCGGKTRKEEGPVKDTCLTHIEKLFRCLECGHVFTGCPDDFDPLNYYCNVYRKKPDHEVNWGDENKRKKYHSELLSRFASSVPHFKPDSIIEVGAGAGHFMQSVSNLYNLPVESVLTCELDQGLASYMKKQGFNTLSGDFTKLDIDQKFDLFIALDVIEHLEDIKNLPQKIKKLLNKDGIGLIQVPDHTTRKNGVKQFVEHFHYFNRDSISKLFKDTFEIVKIIHNKSNTVTNSPSMTTIIKNTK